MKLAITAAHVVVMTVLYRNHEKQKAYSSTFYAIGSRPFYYQQPLIFNKQQQLALFA